ncbi:hypothetical protein LINPERHAP1_LOCUS16212 [Linum perenne]
MMEVISWGASQLIWALVPS